MTKQSCKNCNCPIFWDKTINKSYTKKDGTKVTGWWRESASSLEHTKDRCTDFQNSKEFFESANTKRVPEEPKIEESKLKRTDLLQDNEFIKLSEDDIELVENLTQGEKEIHRVVNKQFNTTFPPQFIGMIYKQVSDKFTEIKMKKLE